MGRTSMFRSFVSFCLLIIPASLNAGTTGKIAGKVMDANTREVLIGVNVLVEGTRLGAATDINGLYVIINVPPGKYSLKASSLGYHPFSVRNVQVSVDLTTQIDFELQETSIEIKEEIVVVAERPMIQKDLTYSSTRVTADQIKAYPVEDVATLVDLQAGVVDGHFRGGRSSEVLYMIDGVPVTDSYTGNAGINAETNAIQELEVISGTFNAEYGQAMSGVVNQVTKDGGEKFAGDVSFYFGDYVSADEDLFQNVDRVRPADIYNIEGGISGPVFGISGVTFFFSGRHYYNDGYLYGERIFLPTDLSDFTSDDPSEWVIQRSGDRKFVSLNFERRTTLQGKLTFNLFGSDKLRLHFFHQRRDSKDVGLPDPNEFHRYRLNPDGTYNNFAKGNLVNVKYTSVFSASTFLDVNGAWFSNQEDSYVYEDPFDPRFPDYRSRLAVSGPAFYTGGAEDLHLHRESRYILLKADLVSQITTDHLIKTGVEAKKHRIWIHNFGIRNDQSTSFVPQPAEFGKSKFAHTTRRPEQYAGYIQDKMEFDDLVVNIGVRYDYFDPKADVLVDQLRLGQSPKLEPADPEGQLSPRVGLSYPITDRGVLHVAYGHFFQVPPFDLIFLNPAYNINATERFQVGNPGLRSQRTVGYELGLQQQLSDDIKLDVIGFYKDFKNLIGTEIFDIGNGNKYSQYINRDYGNARGIIVALEKRHTHGFSTTLDYTFQVARGNASDPNSVFLDHEQDPPRESQKQLAPLDWDRRHSLNVTATIGTLGDYTVTLIGKLGSGLPYTPAFQNQRTGLVNSENRPDRVIVDLYATKYLEVFDYSVNFFAKVYNLFDARNENDVFTDTGRADYSLQANFTGSPRGVNTIEEFFTRPEFFSEPRQVIVGMGISF